MYNNKKKRQAPGASDAKATSLSQDLKNVNSLLGKRIKPNGNKIDSASKGSIKLMDDNEVMKLLGKRSRNIPVYPSRKIFYENNKVYGALTKPYFKNYYNSLDRKGRRNLVVFLNGLNNKSIIGVSEIQENDNGDKFLVVKYDNEGRNKSGVVHYMPGMKTLIDLASKFDFQLDLTEIVKESYK